MIRDLGNRLTRQQIGNYRSIITVFMHVEKTAEPGSAARERGVTDIVSVHQQPHVDQSALRRLAQLVMSLRDGKT